MKLNFKLMFWYAVVSFILVFTVLYLEHKDERQVDLCGKVIAKQTLVTGKYQRDDFRIAIQKEGKIYEKEVKFYEYDNIKVNSNICVKVSYSVIKDPTPLWILFLQLVIIVNGLIACIVGIIFILEFNPKKQ